MISWQFGTGPDSPGKATDVSEPVRHARRKGTSVHTQLSHMHVHTQLRHMHVHTHSTCGDNIYTHTDRHRVHREMLINRERIRSMLSWCLRVCGLQKAPV